jgi:hypothetical protein
MLPHIPEFEPGKYFVSTSQDKIVDQIVECLKHYSDHYFPD